MVSQLSSRLLSSYATASSSITSGASSTSHNNNNNNNNNNRSTRSGYSADKEQNLPSLPVLIDLNVKRRKHSDDEERSKRKRLNETAFAAASVKSDLARVGCVPPTLKLKGALALDPNKVQVVLSSAVSASPFLSPTWSAWNDITTDFGAVYAAAVKETAFAYQAPVGMLPPPSPTSHDTECTSSTSSVSDTESDDSRNSSKLMVIKARLEDCVKTDLEPQALYASHFITGTPNISMTMEEAVGVCDFGRLIVLSGPPYEIIHSNACFGRMSGLTSSQTLGKSLQDIISVISKQHIDNDNDNDSSSDSRLSLASCAASSSEGQDVTVYIIGSGTNSNSSSNSNETDDGGTKSPLRCKMRVTPIVSESTKNTAARDSSGADGREVNNVTHFAIDLIDEGFWAETDECGSAEGPNRVIG